MAAVAASTSAELAIPDSGTAAAMLETCLLASATLTAMNNPRSTTATSVTTLSATRIFMVCDTGCDIGCGVGCVMVCPVVRTGCSKASSADGRRPAG